MDKSWMHANKTSVQYREGVNKFIKFAFDHLVPEGSEIYCPCTRCNNCFKKGKKEVEIHLCVHGIVKNYVRWVFHGEDFESKDTDDNTVNDSDELDHEMGPDYNNEMKDIIDDIFVEQIGEASPGHNHNVSSCEADKLERLIRDAEQELYPGCTQFSMLSFITNLLHLKLIHGWTNKSFTELLEILKQAFPEGETLPCSYYRSKKVIRDLGLNYEKIHACKNDCILYWKEYANEDKCPKCSTPRYKSRKGKKGKRVPHKVLRYFPLKPRLQRLFLSRKTAGEMRWHKDKRQNEDNVLRHPADSEAWKDFDKRHELFASESRNVRLGLATDGFNPFGHKNSYSIWPVFLVAYNLPPWMFMKTPFIMMPLLIPGRRAPGHVSAENKATLFKFLRFTFSKETYAIMGVLTMMKDRYKSYQYKLRQRFRKHPTIELALTDIPEKISKLSWRKMCDAWSRQEYTDKCKKAKSNRDKVLVPSVSGSKSFRKVQYKQRNPKTGEDPTLVQLYEATHYNSKKKAWVNNEAENVYLKLKERVAEAIEDGTGPLTAEELSIDVLGYRSGSIKCLGRGGKPSTSLSEKRSHIQLERELEFSRRELEEQRSTNQKLVERIQSLESSHVDMNSKLDFLMQQMARQPSNNPFE